MAQPLSSGPGAPAHRGLNPGTPAACQLADPQILSYFQLVESIWEEEEDDRCNQAGSRLSASMGPSEGGTFSDLSMQSVRTLDMSSHMRCLGCSKPASELSCACNGSAYASVKTQNGLMVRGAAGEGSRSGSRTAEAGEAEPQASTLGHRPRASRTVTKRLPAPVPEFLDMPGTMAQLQAADPEVLSYFQFVESMLERGRIPEEAANGDPKEKEVLSSQGHCLSGRSRGSGSQEGPQVTRSRTAPAHKNVASMPEFFNMQRVIASGPASGGSVTSDAAPGFIKTAVSEEYPLHDNIAKHCRSPKIFLDGPDFPPWKKPSVDHLLSGPESPLPGKASGKAGSARPSSSTKRILLGRGMWRGLL